MNEQSDRPRLIISGYGTAAGGEYSTVRINGRGKITGDVVCDECIINGSGDIEGTVRTKEMAINGTARITDSLHADELKVNGAAGFQKSVRCEQLTVSGSADIGDALSAQDIKVSGALKVTGGCSVERFNSSGRFEIGSLLNAGEINVSLHWSKSSAKEIGGETITVRRGARGLDAIRSIFSIEPGLSADIIEGNDIDLEHTAAKVVRGTNVTLGSGCDIGLVEYTGVLRKKGGPRVGEEKKV